MSIIYNSDGDKLIHLNFRSQFLFAFLILKESRIAFALLFL